MPNSFQVPAGGDLTFSIYNGDAFPQATSRVFLDRLQNPKLHSRGTAPTLPAFSLDGTRAVSTVKPESPGHLILTVATLARTESMKGGEFLDYLKEENLASVIAEREKLGESAKEARERYSKYAKTIVRVGNGDGFYATAVGLPIEFVPEKDPLDLKKGDRLRGRQRVNIAAALRGRRADMKAYAVKDPRDAITALGNFKPKEIEFTTYAGEPIYMATNGTGDTRIVPIDGGPQSKFDTDNVMTLIRAAAGSELADLRVMDEYDAYYLDRRGERPLPVVYAELNDAAHTRYYIDVKTARVAGTYSSRNWVNRWLYHGLHSLDFPWLYKYRPLWDIVVITFMAGGTALCVTSLVLSWRVLKRKFKGLTPMNDLPTEQPSTPAASQSASA